VAVIVRGSLKKKKRGEKGKNDWRSRQRRRRQSGCILVRLPPIGERRRKKIDVRGRLFREGFARLEDLKGGCSVKGGKTKTSGLKVME